jgi:hypothetical protein
VGDHEGRAARYKCLKAPHDERLGCRIEGGGGFVKEQNRGVTQERPGDGDTELLASGERRPALANDGVKPARELGQEVVELGECGSLLDLLERRVRPAIGDIRLHTHREDQRRLQHYAHLLA